LKIPKRRAVSCASLFVFKLRKRTKNFQPLFERADGVSRGGVRTRTVKAGKIKANKMEA
jgi:hypothetical protein